MIAQHEKDQKPVAPPAAGFRRIIPLGNLGGSLHQTLGTLGTPFSYSHAHAEKTFFSENPIFSHEGEECKKPVPNVPSPPPLSVEQVSTAAAASRKQAHDPLPAFLFRPPVRSMDLSDPNCDRVRDGSLIIALECHNGKLRPRILYADAKHHAFWDCTANEHVPPPRFYLPVSENPGFDPIRGFLNQDDAAQPPARKSGGSAPEVSNRARPHQIITDRKRLAEVVAALQGESAIALDIETYGERKSDALDPWRGDIRLLQLTGADTCIFLLDLQAIGYDLGPLAEILVSKTVIGHNIKFDALWLLVKCGFRLPRVFCTLTAARLLAAGTKPGNNLDQCLDRYLAVPAAADHSTSDWGAMLLSDNKIAYAARDVAHLHSLKGVMEHELEMVGLDGVADLEMRLIPQIVAMEHSGFAVDKDKLISVEAAAREQSAAAAAKVRDLLGCPGLNLGSPKQLLAALKAKGIHLDSTNEEALQASGDTALVPKILSARSFEKTAQQAEKLLASVAPDGRIHGQFDPTGTATGRFSSKSPNLQNIGRGDLRACFIAPPGRSLVVADYSQVELRVAAAITGEQVMIDAYKRGDDLHKITAAAVLGKPLDEITKGDRQLSKAVNFGLLFGQQPRRLVSYAKTSYGVTMTEDEARAIRQKFFATYGRLRQWHGQSHQQAERGIKEVRTVTGRRRLIPSNASAWERFTALVNTPVQGGSADGIKQALVDLAGRLPEGARIISTVHDEIIVECDQAQATTVRDLLANIMREAMQVLFPQVPIEVEARVCSNWGEKA